MSDNYIDSNGLNLQKLPEIVAQLTAGMTGIYGNDISVDANSPDGQMINIYAQAKIDTLDLISQVFQSFSPTTAIGSALDNICAINGVTRNGSTYTRFTFPIISTSVVNLIGVSSNSGTPFTISDPSGNIYYLLDDTTTSIGTNTLTFESASPGTYSLSSTTPMTIVTTFAGITGPTGATGASVTVVGIDEETDPDLRFRRVLSVANPSTGYLDGLIGALSDLPYVDNAIVYENYTSVTGPTATGSIGPHSIWCIIDYIGPTGPTGGSGSTGSTGLSGASKIAQTIYLHRNAGCGMTGSIYENIMQLNGYSIPIQYDLPTYETLQINLILHSLNSSHTIDNTFLSDTILNNISYKVGQTADFSTISSLVKSADPIAVITGGGLGVSGVTGATASYLDPSTAYNKWILQAANINITEI